MAYRDYANRTYKGRKFLAVFFFLICLGLSGFGFAAFGIATGANQTAMQDSGDYSKPVESYLVWLYPLISAVMWLLAGFLIAGLTWKKSKTT
jgi:hypothetical protein